MNYQEFKNAVMKYAQTNQLKDYELYYTEAEGTSVETYMTEVKGFSTDSSLGVCFKCIINDKTGYASTENMTEAEAESIVFRAIENAKSIESDTPSFIHQAGDTYAAYEKAADSIPSSSELVDFALELQKNIYNQDERVIDGTQSYAGYHVQKTALLNSNGLDLENESAFFYSYGMAIVSDGENMYDGMCIESGQMSTIDIEKMAKETVKDAVETIGYTTVESGEYTVVFSNKVMASLLTTYASVFSAEAVQKDLSLLKDKEGEQIAADIITLTDDPMYKDSLVKCTFDAEGVATYKKNVIENGKLVTFLHNLSTAAKANVKTTGNASKASYAAPIGIRPYSFYINPVKGTLEELFEEAVSGIYVTSVEGMHAGANPITGDFSLSAGGFKIENGKKAGPIKGFTVSGNFLTLLKEISTVGEDLKFNPMALGESRCGSPSVLVKGIKVAGK